MKPNIRDHLKDKICLFAFPSIFHDKENIVEWKCKFQSLQNKSYGKIKARKNRTDVLFRFFLSGVFQLLSGSIMKTKRKEVGAPPLLRRPFSASIDTKSRQKWQKRGSQRKLDAFWQMSVSELVPTLDLPHYKKVCYSWGARGAATSFTAAVLFNFSSFCTWIAWIQCCCAILLLLRIYFFKGRHFT